MNKAILALFSVQIGLSVFAQADILPDSVMNILLQLPVVAILAYIIVYFLRWHDAQMANANQWHREQVTALFKALNDFTDVVGELNKQLVINTATVNESIKAHELVQDVKDLLLKIQEVKDD